MEFKTENKKMEYKNEENINRIILYIIAIAGFVLAIVAIVKAYDDVSIINGTDVKTVFSRTGDIIAVNGDYSADQVTNTIDQSSLTSKGDLFAATSKEKAGVLTSGTDGFVLISDSSKPTGLKWGQVDIFNKEILNPAMLNPAMLNPAMLNPLFKYIASAKYNEVSIWVTSKLTYSPKAKIAITSGQVKYGPYTSVDGLEWTDQKGIFPFMYTTIEYSPKLNLFTAIEINGTKICTSADGITWTEESPTQSLFDKSGNSVQLKWFIEFGKFFTGSKDEDNRIYTSTDGKVYNLIKSNRRAIDFATNGFIIVAVGDDGPQYSTDGGDSWSNSETSTGMGCVAYSPTTGLFVSGQRGGGLNVIWHSTDGITWKLSGGTIITKAIRCIKWVQHLQMFVLGADSGMWISNDGFYFLNVYIPLLLKSIYGIQYIKEWGMLFGLGNGNNLVHTPKLFIF
jgi:hypothetical protein